MLAETVNKDDGGDGGSDGIPGLCENLVAVLGLNPLLLGSGLGAELCC
jgi:hypothetical protein